MSMSISGDLLERPSKRRATEPKQDSFIEVVAVKKDIKVCIHQAGSVRNMCVLCEKELDDESASTSGYLHKGLRLTGTYENARLSSTDMEDLLRQKKLYLVLDLDFTLLNTTQLMSLKPDEAYLEGQSDSLEEISKGSLFILEHMCLITKLRPFVRTFLREASAMFEMYINTMGDRPYAEQMAKLLDPRDEYFRGRIISRDDYDTLLNFQKSLKVLQGRERAVVILDDTEEAWKQHKENMIVINRYHFFASSLLKYKKSLSQLKTDERELNGVLACVLKVLKQIHHMFFKELDCSSDSRDTRQLLRSIL